MLLAGVPKTIVSDDGIASVVSELYEPYDLGVPYARNQLAVDEGLEGAAFQGCVQETLRYSR